MIMFNSRRNKYIINDLFFSFFPYFCNLCLPNGSERCLDVFQNCRDTLVMQFVKFLRLLHDRSEHIEILNHNLPKYIQQRVLYSFARMSKINTICNHSFSIQSTVLFDCFGINYIIGYFIFIHIY